jgi:hypothetical protein
MARRRHDAGRADGGVQHRYSPQVDREPTMNHPLLPDADTRWRADAVRHQVLRRALPAQRHDVLGPLSALRMGLALFKRRLQADAPDAGALGQRLADLEQQVTEAVAAVAVLRCWDDGRHPAQPVGPLLRACAELLRTGASLRGHRLDGPRDTELDAAAAAVVAVPDAHYVVLAWLMAAIDGAAEPTQLTLSLQADHVALRMQPSDAAPAGLPLGLVSGTPPLSPQALGWLLADTGWTLRHGDGGAQQLHWPAPPAAASVA